MTPSFFIAEAASQLIDRATACRQQPLHVVFRTGHHVQRQTIGSARANKPGFEWD
ncbi:Uncharacterised protein [Yersinia massiliensis]|nr:Uncharacterised protein [Yersinia massiliensis]